MMAPVALPPRSWCKSLLHQAFPAGRLLVLLRRKFSSFDMVFFRDVAGLADESQIYEVYLKYGLKDGLKDGVRHAI